MTRWFSERFGFDSEQGTNHPLPSPTDTEGFPQPLGLRWNWFLPNKELGGWLRCGRDGGMWLAVGPRRGIRVSERITSGGRGKMWIWADTGRVVGPLKWLSFVLTRDHYCPTGVFCLSPNNSLPKFIDGHHTQH